MPAGFPKCKHRNIIVGVSYVLRDSKREMKFNHHELALYASTRLGKSDKEGSLWMKEVDNKAKKKQSEQTAPLYSFEQRQNFSLASLCSLRP